MTSGLRIRGGLSLARHKPGLDRPILEVPIPASVVLPLLGYRDRALRPVVAVGDAIRAGDRLADGLIASVTGRVTAIENRAVSSRSVASAPCVVIESDGSARTNRCSLESATLAPLSPELRMRHAGIDGLGGAGFPVGAKLDALAARAGDGTSGCRRLLINACECEPGIACDEALLQADAPGVVAAVVSLIAALQPDETRFVIERDKERALDAVTAALHDVDGVVLQPIEPLYPSGAERVLVDLIARQCGEPALGDNERPVERGVLCLNVATVHALGEALSGRQPNSRIVTVSGVDSTDAVNARVVFGTPARAVFDACDVPIPDGSLLQVGGPLSGHAHEAFDLPVTATLHALSIRAPQSPANQPRPCIRCGECARVCPVDLQPQQLFWYADDRAALQRHHVARCLECGCCDAVCPSDLPLTATFRTVRAGIAQSQAAAADADRADRLYQRREARLAREDSSPRVAHAALHDPVDANAPTSAVPSSPDAVPARDARVDAALARARARAGTRTRLATGASATPATGSAGRSDADE